MGIYDHESSMLMHTSTSCDARGRNPLEPPFSYFTGIFILFSLSTGTLSPAWYCACVYQGRSYRGDLEILEMFVDITVNTTALQIREGYGQLNGFGDWPHYP